MRSKTTGHPPPNERQNRVSSVKPPTTVSCRRTRERQLYHVHILLSLPHASFSRRHSPITERHRLLHDCGRSVYGVPIIWLSMSLYVFGDWIYNHVYNKFTIVYDLFGKNCTMCGSQLHVRLDNTSARLLQLPELKGEGYMARTTEETNAVTDAAHSTAGLHRKLFVMHFLHDVLSRCGLNRFKHFIHFFFFLLQTCDYRTTFE